MNFEGKSFLKLLDFTPEEISALIDLAANLKAKKKAGVISRKQGFLWYWSLPMGDMPREKNRLSDE